MTILEKHSARFRRGLASLGLLFLATACSPKWSMRVAQPETELQWPFQPGRPKVVYEKALTGFAREKGSSSAWRAVVYGSGKDNPDSFLLPVGVATGGDGRMAVADLGRRCVHLYLPAQQLYMKVEGSKTVRMVSPVAVAFDEALTLYASDSSGRIFAFDSRGEFLFNLEKAGDEKLQRPTGVAYSPTRKLLYVVDTLANRVHALHPDGSLAFSFGRRGEEQGSFNFPTHIFWSPPGELFVADSLDFRIEIFDEAGKVLGSFGHHGDGSGDVAMPKGVAVDRDGVIYVVDGIFDNVQLFDRQGAFLLTLGGRGIDFGEFWLPTGAFISNSGELYICDTYNHRVQIFRITERYAAHES